MLNSLYRFVVFAALALAVVVGLFIAWWIAMIAALGLMAYVGVRKLMGKPLWGGINRAAGDDGLSHDYRRGPVVLEGEFREVQDPSRRVGRADE